MTYTHRDEVYRALPAFNYGKKQSAIKLTRIEGRVLPATLDVSAVVFSDPGG